MHARSFPLPVLLGAVLATFTSLAPNAYAQEADAGSYVEQKVAIRSFSASGRKAKAAAAKVEAAFAEAWKAQRPDDDALGGRAPKAQRKKSKRVADAVTAASRASVTHLVDGMITKKGRRTTVNLLLIQASDATVLSTQKVVLGRKYSAKSFAKAVGKLVAAIPEPPPKPEPKLEPEPEPEVEVAKAEVKEPVVNTPVAEETDVESSGGGGGFGSVLAGSGLFFLGSGVTAMAAGGVFAAGAFFGRDWENKAALNSALREEVNTAIFWTSLGADVIIVSGVVVTLIGVGALTTGLLIE